ncbi:DUF1428 domain-containing protein [Hoeflea sp.]|uniref:DUF1428 domain-containing protein n=1 Tax=Hoeflea sp. TaxID=1940281 RepID=UPI003B51CDA3
MTYVQGFLVPVRNDNKAKYTEMAKMGSRIFKKNGATSVVECWGVDVPDGKVTSFPMAVKLEEGETVVFSMDRLAGCGDGQNGHGRSDEGLRDGTRTPDGRHAF